MLKSIVFDQLKRGLRESDTARLSVAIVGIGAIAAIRIVRGPKQPAVYRRRIRAGRVFEIRMVERPGKRG